MWKVLTSPRIGPTLPYTPEPASLTRSSICPNFSPSKTPAPFRTMRSRTPSRGLEASSSKREFKGEPRASDSGKARLRYMLCACRTSPCLYFGHLIFLFSFQPVYFIFALLSPAPFLVVTQTRDHIAGSSPTLPPTAVQALHFVRREKSSARSSLVDSRQHYTRFIIV